MAEFVTKNPPEFSTEMRMLETNDPGHANVFNPLLEQLLNNDAFLKAIADAAKEHMQNGEIHVTEQDKEYWDAKAGTGTATQSAAGLMGAGDKQKLDNVAENAEVNQDAFSKVKVGEVTITANGKTATFTLEAGDNITLTADNATKKVTIKSNRDNGNADTLDGYHAEHFAAADHGHDGRYHTKTEINNLLAGKAASSHSHTKASITDFPSSMPPTEHYHDGRYYTETEVNNLLAGKAASSHSHAYLPLSGGTMTGNLVMNVGKKIQIYSGADDTSGLFFDNKMDSTKKTYRISIGSVSTSDGMTSHCLRIGIAGVYNDALYIGENYALASGYYSVFCFNGYYYLGSSRHPFKALYANTGTIQTSDREKKKDIKEFDDKFVEDFIMGLVPVSYMLRENESGRTHYGLIAQDVEELMDRLEMDSKDFAGFIKSPRYKETIEEIEVENEVEDEDGKKKIVKEKRQNVKATLIENEYEYALRYEEFISPIIKMLQILNNKLSTQQEEIGKLKTQIEELKVN